MKSISPNTRKAVAQVQSAAEVAQVSPITSDGTIHIAELLRPRPLKAFGFSHLGAAGGGSDQYVFIGDSKGKIASKLSLSATNFDTGYGCDSNANLNAYLEEHPVSISEIKLKVSNLNQQAKEIYYCIYNMDGEVDKVNITSEFRRAISQNSEDSTVQSAKFEGLVLGAFRCLLFYIDDTYTLEANFTPSARRV